MKSTFSILVVSALAAFSLTTQAVTFDPQVRYSQAIIDNSIYGFKANTNAVAFKKYNANGELISDNDYGKSELDYVPGLVAKAVIEAVDYYQNEDFAKPWFYSIAAYGNNFFNGVKNGGGSLDDLNAVKLYFGLRELTKGGAAFENSTTAANCATAIELARQGLAAHNTKYSIKTTSEGSNPNDNAPISNAAAFPLLGGGTANVVGGWWHKGVYTNQLWCDGQYMGPALLAQLVASGDGNISGTADGDWAIVAKQFDIAWKYLWDSEAQLLWHAVAFDNGVSGSHSDTWYGLSESCHHSATYWGRAEGWYFMALVDVLEQMQIAGKTSTQAYTDLKNQLNAIAAGLVACQDATSKCWYQLLGYNSSFGATGVSTSSPSEAQKVEDGDNAYYATTGKQSTSKIYNYLESSCSFLFAAAYLKGARLRLFNDNEAMRLVGKNAYEGAIARFWDGNKLIDCCASAGLGGSDSKNAKYAEKYRSGSPAYYLQSYDVTRITTYTEGKVLGAAILAAVEYERAYMPVNESCRCLRVRTNRP